MSTNLKDVYGAKAYRGPEGDPAAYFQVYSCPISEKKRVRQKTCFKIASSESEEANIALAEKWVRTILWLVKEPEKNVSSLEGKIWWLRSHVKSNIWRVFFLFERVGRLENFSDVCKVVIGRSRAGVAIDSITLQF